jgi:hypothetical protein
VSDILVELEIGAEANQQLEKRQQPPADSFSRSVAVCGRISQTSGPTFNEKTTPAQGQLALPTGAKIAKIAIFSRPYDSVCVADQPCCTPDQPR